LCQDISEADYLQASAEKNVLQLVWRMEADAAQEALAPSWPVVFTSRSVVFSNSEPMELGL
jgi:hypothetical protein